MMLVVLVSCFTVSASAAETDSNIFHSVDLTWFEYSNSWSPYDDAAWTRVEGQSFYPSATTFYVRFPNPKIDVSYMAWINVTTYAGLVSSANRIGAFSPVGAEIYNPSNGKYSMTYGMVGRGTGEMLYFEFTVVNLGHAFTFDAVRISYQTQWGEFVGEYGWSTSTSISSLPYHDTYEGSADSIIRNFRMKPHANYDSFGFFLTTSNADIQSVVAATDIDLSNGSMTPLEVTIHNTSYLGSSGNLVLQDSAYISVSGVPAGTEVTFIVTCSRPDTNGTSQLIFSQGFFLMDYDTEWAFIQKTFYNFQKALDGILDALRGGDDATSDEFQNSVNEQQEQLDEICGAMDSVTKPPTDDINVSVGDIVSPDDSQSAMAGFTVILGNDIIFRMVLMSLTFALAGYALYGKR